MPAEPLLWNEQSERSSVSFQTLMSLPDIEEPKIMVPLLPAVGIALLAGKPDCGKSTFARQLALAIAMHKKDFLGFKLSPREGRVIYVATEETQNAAASCWQKQLAGLAMDEEDGSGQSAIHIDTIFDDGEGPEHTYKRIEEELELSPCDLVLIDSFGDVFTGKDANSNSELRKALQPFHALAMRHETLILFLTHLTKTGYNVAPDQMHVAGGAALVQKSRTVLQLIKEEGGTRLFCVTKGNGVPEEYKARAMRLFFDPTYLLYETTDETIAIAEIGKGTTGQRHNFDWESVFGDELELPTGEIQRRIIASHRIKPRMARDYMAKCLFRTRYGHWTYSSDFAASVSGEEPGTRPVASTDLAPAEGDTDET